MSATVLQFRPKPAPAPAPVPTADILAWWAQWYASYWQAVADSLQGQRR